MTLQQALRLLVALGATSAVLADDPGTATGGDGPDSPAVSNPAGTDTDSMASFRAIVAQVMAQIDARESDSDAPAPDADPAAVVQRNLGVGFGHGAGNAGDRPPAAQGARGGAADATIQSSDPSVGFVVPYRDGCSGNGHASSTLGPSGNNGGFGAGDCGDPSPAD